MTLFLPPLLGLGRSPGCRQWAEYINSIAQLIDEKYQDIGNTYQDIGNTYQDIGNTYQDFTLEIDMISLEQSI